MWLIAHTRCGAATSLAKRLTGNWLQSQLWAKVFTSAKYEVSFPCMPPCVPQTKKSPHTGQHYLIRGARFSRKRESRSTYTRQYEVFCFHSVDPLSVVTHKVIALPCVYCVQHGCGGSLHFSSVHAAAREHHTHLFQVCMQNKGNSENTVVVCCVQQGWL